MTRITEIILHWLHDPFFSEISNAVSEGDHYELNAVIEKWNQIMR